MAAIVVLSAGWLGLEPRQAIAASLTIDISVVVSGSNATIVSTVNRQPKAIVGCTTQLDARAPMPCGLPTNTSKSTATYQVALAGLSTGSHSVNVIVTLSDRGVAGSSTSFEVGPCQVTNQRTTFSYFGEGENLQTAIDAAQSGDTLQIRGRCVGTFRVGDFRNVSTTLTLVGVATAEYPVATLDADEAGRVIHMEFCGGSACMTDLTLTDIMVTGGRAENLGGGTINDVGGGIYNNHGALTLNGSTQLRDNHAAYGGGLASYGTTTMSDTAEVIDNTSTLDGGGIYGTGAPLTMRGSARVTGNLAGGSGGGIYHFGGTLTLDGNALVTGNTSGISGGGIYNFGLVISCDSWTGAISPNNPDDPPAVTQVTC